ncbi:hypothetical protein, partial [Ralstonia solanacearum]
MAHQCNRAQQQIVRHERTGQPRPALSHRLIHNSRSIFKHTSRNPLK